MQRFAVILTLLITFITVVSLIFKADKPTIKVGVLHSLTGTMAISEKGVMEATLLAIEQINEAGGLLGRMLEPIVVDGQSNARIFASEAERLITEEHVSVIFGCWTSASRKRVKTIVEAHKHLLFYPVQYEGLEQSSHIIYMGATPNQQIIPATSWAIETLGPRIYLVGSDYVFPRVANWMIHQQAPPLGGIIIGERYIPLGDNNIDIILDDIIRLQPDVVLNTINGDANIAFFQALHQAGLTADKVPVLSFSLGESELAHITNPDETRGHYAAWNYFQSIDSPANVAFTKAYQARFGADKAISDPMEAAWVGVQLWAQAVAIAQSDDTTVVRQTIIHQSILAPEGMVSIDAKTQHAWKTVRIGQVRDDGQFSIRWTSEEPIRPAPYPAFISMTEAHLFLEQLYINWDSHWAAPKKLQGHTP